MSLWNLGQFHKKLNFVRNCLIKVRIEKFFCTNGYLHNFMSLVFVNDVITTYLNGVGISCVVGCCSIFFFFQLSWMKYQFIVRWLRVNTVYLMVYQYVSFTVVLPRLAAIAHANNNTSVDARKSDVATALFEAYSALSCCCILVYYLYNIF